MKRISTLVVLALILAGGVFLVLRARATRPRPIASSASPRVETLARDEVPLEPPPTVEPAQERAAEISAVPPEDAAAPSVTTAPASTRAVVRGRILLEGGAPAAGAALRMHGWPGNSDRVRQFGAPEHWEQPSGTCDPDGAFELAFDPPRAYQFVLEASFPGHAAADWRWSGIEAGSTVDVGDVVLVRAGAIVGRIVDRDGAPVPAHWMVHAEAAPNQLAGDRDETRVTARADPATTEFRLEGLPPGPVQIKANAPNVSWVEGPIVDVRAGEDVEAVILYQGGSPSSRVTVTTFTPPFFIFADEVSGIRLLRDGVAIAKAAKVERSAQSFAFEGVEPGEYEIVIEDERYEPWRKTGVRPGEEVRALLRGSAGIVLDVRDAESGAAVPRYTLDLVFLFGPNRQVSPDTFRIQEADEDPPAGGAFLGLIPHACELVVSAPGYARTSVPLGELAPGERRSVSALLARGASIGVRLVTAEGAAVARAEVALYRGTVDEETLADFWEKVAYEEEHGEPERAETDANGRVAFEGLAGGPWTVVATSGPARVTAHVETVPASIELALPALAFLEGTVRGPARALESLLVAVAAAGENEDEDEPSWTHDAEGLVSRLDASGAFRLGPMTAGEWSVRFVLPAHSGPGDVDDDFQPGGVIEVDTIRVAGGETLRREYDVGDRAPGTLEVDVLVNGAPARGAVVALYRVEPDGEIAPQPEAVNLLESGATRVGPVFPGALRVGVHDMNERWAYAHPAVITIEPGGDARVAVAVELVRARLEVRDAETKEPLAIGIRWTSESGGITLRGTAQADARGVVEAELPPGEYELSAFGPEHRGELVVQWTASGVVPAVMELERRDR